MCYEDNDTDFSEIEHAYILFHPAFNGFLLFVHACWLRVTQGYILEYFGESGRGGGVLKRKKTRERSLSRVIFSGSL